MSHFLQQNIKGECSAETKETLLLTISAILGEIIDENRQGESKSGTTQFNKDKTRSIFDSKKIPKISISDYITRILKYSSIENNTLITALIYIDRLCDYNKLVLTVNNIHR